MRLYTNGKCFLISFTAQSLKKVFKTPWSPPIHDTAWHDNVINRCIGSAKLLCKERKKSNQSMQCCIGLHYHLKFVVGKICFNVCLFFERRLVLTKNIVETNMKH